jgi:hypothetical protein
MLLTFRSHNSEIRTDPASTKMRSGGFGQRTNRTPKYGVFCKNEEFHTALNIRLIQDTMLADCGIDDIKKLDKFTT